MRHALRTLLPLALILTAIAPAAALQRSGYEIEILVDGVPLREYAARHATYVEALEGREYSIRLSNLSGRRVAIALSVDGLNSIDAKTTSARDAAKWILAPWETITIDGWQTSGSTARRFFFTTEERSYGAWLGKTKNLGIISAAVFREKQQDPSPIQRPKSRRSRRGDEGLGEPAPAPAAEDGAAPRSGPTQGLDSDAKRKAEAETELSDDLAATGIGRQVENRVRRVRFDGEEAPAAVLELRYEYHDALVHLGVLPRPCAHREDPLARRERARGFQDAGFAPDPYR